MCGHNTAMTQLALFVLVRARGRSDSCALSRRVNLRRPVVPSINPSLGPPDTLPRPRFTSSQTT